jgi:hypothetical protein
VPTFKDTRSLDNYLNLKGQEIAEQILRKEAQRLRDCLQVQLDSYYNSYSPSMYERTYGLQNSLTLDDLIDIDVIGGGNGSLSMTISFNEGAKGTSLFSSEEVNKALLINYGWAVKKDVWFRDIYRFGYFEGDGFIEDGINDFFTSNPYNIKIELHVGDSIFTYS